MRPLALMVALGLGMSVALAADPSPAATAPTTGISPVTPALAPLRVMSFNARYGTAPDGENAWDRRRENLFATIRDFGPDLIGFQEVLARQEDDIEKHMTEYSFYGVGPEDGARKGQMSLIGYRKDQFRLIAAGTFWLSETPDVAGSKSWDSAQMRICSWVRLYDRKAARELLYANTHFDHRGVVARREASRVVLERLTPLAAGRPAILTGDLNSREDTPAYQTLVRLETPGSIRWIDAYRAIYPERQADESSFHGFRGGVQGSRIDYVFCTEHFTPTAASIVRTSRDGRYPSDHYPVTAILMPRESPPR